MKLSPRTSAILIVITAILVVAMAALEFPSYYAWQQQRMVKCVLTANPDELLSAGRDLLGRRPGFVGQISASSPDVPRTIRLLKPTYISISTNSVGVDFSDAANPFGILVYAAGAHPPDPDKYGPGPLQWSSVTGLAMRLGAFGVLRSS